MLYLGCVETSISTNTLRVKLVITLERHIMWLCRHIIMPGVASCKQVDTKMHACYLC